ncbi:MAG: DNA polymerase III subunit delta [Faecalibacterium sp.]|nr:DNA polymerase III subunit delta [Ruminococcus sp.]MCM1393201.1 DNA polymerase III subunit delta [Ruminococcus sp.]MCM1486598.1 DNA polymerase III subunit delta [Faecalibacterium sp.]
MASFDEKQLKQHIKTKDFFCVYLIFGDESYLKQFYINTIVSKTIDPAFESFNFERFDGKGLDLRDVYDRAQLMPMMSDKRCIVVDDFKLDGLSDKDVRAMDESFSALPESTVLIFKQDNVPFSKKSGKKVMAVFDKYGAVCELNKRRGLDLYRPMISSAAKQDCTLDNAVAQYLVSCVGDDFNVIINELSKVCNYVGSGVITKADVDAVAVKTVDSKVYQLTKALIANNFDKAYEVLNSLVKQKTESEYILGAIIGTYVDMYRVKVAAAGGVHPSTLKDYFNYRGREFTIDNAVRDSSKMDIAVLRRCLEALSEADMKLKTGRDSGTLVLEQLMVKLLLIANGERV